MARRLSAAVALAAVLLTTVTPVALAECTDWPIRATERLHVRHAFTATVTEASRETDPQAPDNADFDWHTELAVERMYRGRVPDLIVANGWDVGCHFVRGDRLQTGDRLFVAGSAFRPNAAPFDPFDGQVIVWKRSGESWEFNEGALSHGSDEAFYPKVARTATTTGDILRLVSAASVPDTSTMPAPAERGGNAVIPVLALSFLAVLTLALKRSRSLAGRSR